jgi:hypothetical protein
MTFREEEPTRAWSTHAWSAHGRPHVSPLYSPWQLLYVDDVLDAPGAQVGLAALRAPAEQRDAAFDRVRELLEGQHADWQALDGAWRPLMKLLTRLQNRYLPEVTGRARMLYDVVQQRYVDVWQAEVELFDPQATAAELQVATPQVTDAYWFLTERGIDREPQDGLEVLRRARPRAAHKRVRGMPRRAQDHFDAAEVLRRFIIDLTGQAPSRTPMWPMDGRQPERAALYDRGPAGRTTREQLQQELVQTGLYPHAVHVVGEGKSEKEMVRRLVEGLLGRQLADEIGFTDLGGSGSASKLTTMVGGFTTYAERTVVVVDSEGAMARYVTGLIRAGELPEEDVMLFGNNLEESNFTPTEMLEVLTERAANPPDERPAVTLDLPVEDLLAEHRTRRRTAGEEPGLARIMLGLAEDPKYGGPIRLSKSELAQALADRMLRDLDNCPDDEEALNDLRARRPVLKFVLDRVIPVIAGRRRP